MSWNKRRVRFSGLCEQFRHRLVLFDTCQAEIQSPETERQLAMIDAEAMQNGGLHVRNMDRAINDIETEFVSRPKRGTRRDTTTSEPHCKRLRMMIAAHAST